jgi:multiple sugar transport system permease protein
MVSEQRVDALNNLSVHHSVKTEVWHMERRQSRFGLLLVLPAVAMILLFIGYPVVYSFLLTFSDFNIHGAQWFTAGFSNYEQVLQDRQFRTAFTFTLRYTAIYVPLSVLFGLLVGVLLQQVKVGTTFFRSLLFLPTVIPISMGLLMFQWVLDPSNGIVNRLIRNVFGNSMDSIQWLNSMDTVFGTLVGITLWGFGPWILLLAGLLAIPKDFYEAARVDGASHTQEFFYITLPQMRNTLMVVTTLQIIKALKIFVPIYMLTGGNPAGRTRSLYFLVFQKVNQGQNWYAYASTVGWVFTAIVVVITAATIFIMRVRRD